MTRRVAQVIGIDDANIEEYERLHADAWPGVIDRLRRSHVQSYSIYRYNNLLFSYFEYVGDDYVADMSAIAADTTTQRWWELCMPLQRPVPERGDAEWWHDLTEIFHMD